MKKNLKFVFIIIVIAFSFLISGMYVGKYIFNDKDGDNKNLNGNIDDNINLDIDINNKSVILTLGKNLYYLASDFNLNCHSPYFELTYDRNTDNGTTKIYLDNYYELINKFTDEYIKKNEIMFDNTCHKKNDNNKIDVSACWCGSGSPVAVYSNLEEFQIHSINNDEIVYSVVIKMYNNDSNELINTYNDHFKIVKIDGDWKIDNYTYRLFDNIIFSAK